MSVFVVTAVVLVAIPGPNMLFILGRGAGRQVWRNSIERQKAAALTDRLPSGATYPHKELIKRLLVDKCELCG